MVASETIAPRFIDPQGRPLELLLYAKAYCPYCRRVLRRARELGLELDQRDTTLRENRERLIEVGGKRQVPCLLVNGEPMYESADIIQFLETRVRRAG
jgi:glutathione S-transferase